MTEFPLLVKSYSLNTKLVSKRLQSKSCLVVMIQKFENSLDQGSAYVALFADLSKAFDCLPHHLIIEKLNSFRFDKASLRFMHSYLTGSYQEAKVNSSYSLWSLMKHGVPQGSILSFTLFNIFNI